MFRIAICDDNQLFCSEIENYLYSYYGEKSIDVDVFYTGEELYDVMNSNIDFDLIFLDIEFQMMDGVTVGEMIRTNLKNERVQIVYISINDSYALELFKNRPLHFLVKPVSQNQIIEVTNKAIQLSNRLYKSFVFNFERNYYKLYYGDIMYFESNARKIIVHTVNAEYSFYGKLDMVEEETRSEFLRIHKSYLVNPVYVTKYGMEQVVLSNDKILPISSKLQKTVKTRILKKWSNI